MMSGANTTPTKAEALEALDWIVQEYLAPFASGSPIDNKVQTIRAALSAGPRKPAENHDVIWLEPVSTDPDTGRCWADDQVEDDWIKYVRADLCAGEALHDIEFQKWLGRALVSSKKAQEDWMRCHGREDNDLKAHIVRLERVLDVLTPPQGDA